MQDDAKYKIILCSLPDVGAITAMRLIRHFGSARAALEADEASLMEVEKIGKATARSIKENSSKFDFEKTDAKMRKLGITYLPFDAPEYPRLLAKIPGAPVGFYNIGNCNFNSPCISIVGSRNCSSYGRLVARNFAAAFARAGFVVVSGMARGIDSCAHMGALDAGGKTVAVLGCGVDVVYPPENADLYRRIISSGAVISEFPLSKGADRPNFPIRNRIISALSLATIVVESDIRGGSMITARVAAEQGRDVFAIPGRIDQDTSRGCNALIKDGVRIATCPEDVIESLRFSGQLNLDFSPNANETAPEAEIKKERHSSSGADGVFTIKLSPEEKRVAECFEIGDTLNADDVAERSKMEISKCLTALTMLEIKKVLARTGGLWERKM